MFHPFALLCTIALLVAAPALADDLVSSSDASTAPVRETLSLRAAVLQALDESHEAHAARLERGRADDSLSARRGAYWPQLSLSTQAGYSNRQNERLTALDDKGRVREYGLSNLGNDPWLSVVFDQVLVDLRRWRELDRESLSAEAAAIVEREARERVAYEVVRRYAFLLHAERVVQIARQGLEDSVWLSEQVARLDRAGRVLSNEVLQAELARDSAQMDLHSADAELRAARGALWLAIDPDPEPASWPALLAASLPELRFDVRAAGGGEGLEQLLQRAPDSQLHDLQRRIEEASVSAARAARYPSLQLRGGYAHYGIKRFDQYTDEAFVFVGLELPLFDGFQASSELAGARKSAGVARLRQQSQLAAKRARVRDLEAQFGLAGERLELAQRRASTTLEAQRLADLQLKAQRGSAAEAQRARDETQRDRRAASDLAFQRVELWAMLQRELGSLTSSITGDAAAAPSSAVR